MKKTILSIFLVVVIVYLVRGSLLSHKESKPKYNKEVHESQLALIEQAKKDGFVDYGSVCPDILVDADLWEQVPYVIKKGIGTAIALEECEGVVVIRDNLNNEILLNCNYNDCTSPESDTNTVKMKIKSIKF